MYIRLILFGILTYMIIRYIRRFFAGLGASKDSSVKSKPTDSKRKVSKDAGEYIDFEEME